MITKTISVTEYKALLKLAPKYAISTVNGKSVEQGICLDTPKNGNNKGKIFQIAYMSEEVWYESLANVKTSEGKPIQLGTKHIPKEGNHAFIVGKYPDDEKTFQRFQDTRLTFPVNFARQVSESLDDQMTDSLDCYKDTQRVFLYAGETYIFQLGKNPKHKQYVLPYIEDIEDDELEVLERKLFEIFLRYNMTFHDPEGKDI